MKKDSKKNRRSNRRASNRVNSPKAHLESLESSTEDKINELNRITNLLGGKLVIRDPEPVVPRDTIHTQKTKELHEMTPTPDFGGLAIREANPRAHTNSAPSGQNNSDMNRITGRHSGAQVSIHAPGSQDNNTFGSPIPLGFGDLTIRPARGPADTPGGRQKVNEMNCIPDRQQGREVMSRIIAQARQDPTDTINGRGESDADRNVPRPAVGESIDPVPIPQNTDTLVIDDARRAHFSAGMHELFARHTARQDAKRSAMRDAAGTAGAEIIDAQLNARDQTLHRQTSLRLSQVLAKFADKNEDRRSGNGLRRSGQTVAGRNAVPQDAIEALGTAIKNASLKKAVTGPQVPTESVETTTLKILNAALRSLGITGRHVTSYEGSRVTIRPGFVNTFTRFNSYPTAGFNYAEEEGSATNVDEEGSATDVDSDSQRIKNHELVAEYEAAIIEKEKGSIVPGYATAYNLKFPRIPEEESSSDSEVSNLVYKHNGKIM
ncbi:hypothetical protein Q9L58_007404 [Maublancomyces gigas]|uniref:Uncharacterized protein n=1 Tax=Discina gigas TaxID=1032678 RepID=A0ABR3GCI2_9PEZI